MTPAFPPSSSVTRFFGSRSLEVPADLGRAGERDLAIPVVARHPVGHLRPDGEHLVHALRQVGLGEELGQAERADRRGGRRLHHDGRADAERRSDLVRHQVQREVERGDAEHRTDREPAQQAHPRSQRCLGVETHHLVVPVPDHLGGPPERGDRPRGLDRRPFERLAALTRDQLRVLVDRLGQALGDVIERLGSHMDREVLGRLERLVRGGRSLLDVGVRGDADLVDHAVVERALDLERALARPPVPVHQEGSRAHRGITSFALLPRSWVRRAPSARAGVTTNLSQSTC